MKKENTKDEKSLEEQRKELESKRTPCEVYSRIVGYLRPVQNWNPGKTAEYHDRINFKIDV